MAYKLPNPERDRTERRRELKRLRTKTEPGRERAERSAELAVIFHDSREINHVMELAQLVIGDVDDGIDVLMSAYLKGVEGTLDQLERLAMLSNVGRWTEMADLESEARSKGLAAAVSWTSQVQDEIEQAERLSVIERRFDEAFRKEVQQSM